MGTLRKNCCIILFIDFASIKNIMYSINTYLSKYIKTDLQNVTEKRTKK